MPGLQATGRNRSELADGEPVAPGGSLGSRSQSRTGPEGSLRSLGLVLRASLAEWEGRGLSKPLLQVRESKTTLSWRMVTAEEPWISDLKLLFPNFIARPRFQGSLRAVTAGWPSSWCIFPTNFSLYFSTPTPPQNGWRNLNTGGPHTSLSRPPPHTPHPVFTLCSCPTQS